MLIARQSQPDSSDGEMARFGFCAAPSLVFFFLVVGGGGGGGRGGGSSVQESKIATLGASLCA